MKEIFLWVILPLVLAEAILIGPWLSERLLQWGARGLPEQYRERYADDWLGELDAAPGSLTKLAFAVRVLVRVPATERALTGRDALWLMTAKRMLTLLITGSLLTLQYVFRLSGQFSRNSMANSWLRWRAARSLTSSRQQQVRRQFVAEVEAAAADDTNSTHSRALRASTRLDEIMNPRTARILKRANIHTCGEHTGELGLLNIRDFGHRELEEARLLVQRVLSGRYRRSGHHPPAPASDSALIAPHPSLSPSDMPPVEALPCREDRGCPSASPRTSSPKGVRASVNASRAPVLPGLDWIGRPGTATPMAAGRTTLLILHGAQQWVG